MAWAAGLAGLWLLFNLVAMPLAWGGVNASGGVRGIIQLVILSGFVVFLLFDLLSIPWWIREKGGRRKGNAVGPLVLCAASLVAMMGAKVMVDEIARETPLGGAGGEWFMLYALLAVQLSYAAVVLSRARVP